MNQEQNEKYQVAQEIFEQLRLSKVNGFPFYAYTGLKPQIFSTTELYLKAPRNPKKVKNVLVQYDYGSDTYNVIFNGSERLTDVYFDQLSEIIVNRMGIK